MTFNVESSWVAFIDEAWRRACANTGFTDEEQCPLVLYARARPQESVGECFAAMYGDSESEALLVWFSLFMLDTLPADIRMTLLDDVSRDAPLACRLYLWRDDLSEEEQSLLWGKFSQHMPFMRRQIEEGGAELLSRLRGRL